MKLSFAALFFAAAFASGALAQTTRDCHFGSYRLEGGQTLDVAPSTADTLRWRLFSGESGQLHPQKDGSWTGTRGWSDQPDPRIISFSPCADGGLTFGHEKGHRLPFEVKPSSFSSHGTKLIGRLILPEGDAKVPVVVLIHGSEHDSAIQFNALQRMFPSQGIAAFV